MEHSGEKEGETVSVRSYPATKLTPNLKAQFKEYHSIYLPIEYTTGWRSLDCCVPVPVVQRRQCLDAKP